MAKRMLIDALHPEETRVVIADEKQIFDFDFTSAAKKQLKGNIFLAKITRVEPSLQAAFVEYGGNRQGFLPFSEIHPDYYQIPISDRKRLMEEAERESTREEVPENESQAAEQPDHADEATSSETSAEAAEAQEAPEPAEQETPAYLSQAVEESAPETDTEEPQADDAAPAEAADAEQAEAETASSEGATATEEKPAAEEGVETLPNDEEEVRGRPKRNYAKRYKIQEVIRRGQVVLVQVIKEERGNKGVSLTTYLSLAGRYCVLMPNSPKDGGISRKIASQEDRKRLKQISAEFKFAKGMSVIIRTAGMGRTRAEIKRDYDYLVKLWNHIRETTLHSNAPAEIYEESDIIKRSIRDQYTSDIDDIVVEGDAGYEAAKEFMKLLLPSHTPKIKHYQEGTPLFYAYNVEDQLLQMHDPVVKLRSGGYIVINPTEALISIDVNSGRSTGERNIEETATKTNLEAAMEIARQLRLRDLAGLIVIDFIDMLESRNRRNVERTLKDSLKADRAKIQLGRISPFGLLEMSRQRLRPSISETNMVQCPHCSGRGYIRSNESMSIQIIRALEKEAASGTWSGFRLIAPQAIGLHLLNTKRSSLKSIEDRHGVTVQVLIDSELGLSEYNLEKMRRAQGGDRKGKRDEQQRAPMPPMPDMMPEDEIMEDSAFEEVSASTESSSEEPSQQRDRGGRGPRRRRGRRGSRNRNNNAPDTAEPGGADISTAGGEESSEERQPTSPSEGSPSGRPRRERGRRGGRNRWRDRKEPGNESRDPAGPRLVNDNGNDASDGRALPAFATEDRFPAAPFPEPERKTASAMASPAPESTPRDPNAPPKKGWWQKMIELDD